MKEIALSNGHIALVDDEDFERANQYKWRGRLNWHSVYAVRSPNGTGTPEFMHRLIMSAPRGIGVDHRNGNGLDNRKENLRLCNDSQNQANRHRLSLNTSGFRGVTWNKLARKWQAGIKRHGRSYHLGLFESKEQAARAYDAKAKELFGEFARPNFTEAA